MTPHILLVAGSIRAESISQVTIRTAHELAPDGCRTIVYEGMASLPHFDSSRDGAEPPAAVRTLRASLNAADAYLFTTPEYAGTLPGALKNFLEWAIGGPMYQKPAGWINTSTRPDRAMDAHAALRRVLFYTGALTIPEACVTAPVERRDIQDDRVCNQPARARIVHALEVLATACRASR